MTTRLARFERRLLVLLLCAPLLGLIGVIGAEAVPDGRIADHLVDGQHAGLFNEDRRWPPTPLGTPSRMQRHLECFAFSVGLGDQPERNHVTSAIVSPTYRGWCNGLIPNLKVFETTGELPPGSAYFRYWHGYAVLTRPALGLFGVAGARWIALALLAAALSAIAFALVRALGLATTALLVTPTLLTTDTLIGGLTADGALYLASAWAGGWMAFTLVSRRPDWKTAGLIAALAGALSAYVDMLTTLPGAYALTVVGAMLGFVAAKGGAALRGGCPVAAAAGIGWVAGLIWMWGSKLVIAAIAIGVDGVVDSVRNHANVWVSEGTWSDLEPRPSGLIDNLDFWWRRPLAPWLILGITVALFVAAVRGRYSDKIIASTVLCGAIAAIPVLGWYLALNTHSQVHAVLVYRSIPMAFGGVAALLYVGLTAGVERPADVSGSRSAEALTARLITEPTAEETPSVPAGVPTR